MSDDQTTNMERQNPILRGGPDSEVAHEMATGEQADKNHEAHLGAESSPQDAQRAPTSSASGPEQAVDDAQEYHCDAERIVEFDPGSIATSDFNRAAPAFDTSDPDFAALIRDIQARGGNTEPVRVQRRLHTREDDPTPWQLVSGHRRLEACRQNGIPVRAVIADIDRRTALLDRVRENLHRQDLAPYEEAHQFQELIDWEVAETGSEIADLLNLHKSSVSRTLRLLELPEVFWWLFSDVRLVPRNPALQVLNAWQEDLEGLSQRVQELLNTQQTASDKPSMRAVIRELLKAPDHNDDNTAEALEDDSAEYAVQDEHGRSLFKVRPGNEQVELELPADIWTADLQQLLRDWLESEIDRFRGGKRSG